MKPCTRSTLFRLVLAIRLYGCGLSWLGRYVIPRKYKVCVDARVIRLLRGITFEVLAVLHNNTMAGINARKFKGGGKIGDTISIRRPERWV